MRRLWRVRGARRGHVSGPLHNLVRAPCDRTFEVMKLAACVATLLPLLTCAVGQAHTASQDPSRTSPASSSTPKAGRSSWEDQTVGRPTMKPDSGLAYAACSTPKEQHGTILKLSSTPILQPSVGGKR